MNSNWSMVQPVLEAQPFLRFECILLAHLAYQGQAGLRGRERDGMSQECSILSCFYVLFLMESVPISGFLSTSHIATTF